MLAFFLFMEQSLHDPDLGLVCCYSFGLKSFCSARLLSVFSSLYSNANSQRELDQLFKIYIILLILFSCLVFLSLKLFTNIQNILLSELFCFPCHNVKDIQRTSWEEYCSVLLSAHLFVPGRVPMSCKRSIENQRFCASYKASPAVWLG